MQLRDIRKIYSRIDLLRRKYLCFRRLTNLFRSNKTLKDFAVRDVSFNLRSGQCYGLLGFNGSGKTTLFKILSGDIPPTSGSVRYNFTKKEWRKGNVVGYCPQYDALDDYATVWETLVIYGYLKAVANVKLVVDEALERFELVQFRDKLVMQLSGGKISEAETDNVKIPRQQTQTLHRHRLPRQPARRSPG